VEHSKNVVKLAKIIANIFYAIFGITFVYASYRFYQFAVECHPHVWVVCNILNGILGGVFLVCPLVAIRDGFFKMMYYWLSYFILVFCLIGLSLIISTAMGWGGIDG